MGRKRIESAIQLQSWPELDEALRQIGEKQRTVRAIENEMNEKQAEAAREAEALGRPLKDEIAALEKAIELFTTAHRMDMGKAKSKKLTFGTVSFRASRKIELPKGAEKIRDIINVLFGKGMADCVRSVAPKVDRNALLKYSDEEILATGAGVKRTDTFGYELDEAALGD